MKNGNELISKETDSNKKIKKEKKNPMHYSESVRVQSKKIKKISKVNSWMKNKSNNNIHQKNIKEISKPIWK